MRVLLRAILAAVLAAVLVAVLVAALGAVTASSPASAAGRCGSPVYRTRSGSGSWSGGGYTVANDVWNAAHHRIRQRLTVCSASSWYADTRIPSGTDNQVKSYPDVYLGLHDWSTHHEPRLSAYRALHAHWATRLPHAGRYDAAWDLWLDGVPGDDTGRVRTEVMVWTANRGSVPSGHPVASMRFDGRRWRVWRDRSLGHPYYAFVPRGRLARGSFDLMHPLAWLSHRHWLRSRATLGQVAFGVETVATGGRWLHFATTGFSVDAVRRQ